MSLADDAGMPTAGEIAKAAPNTEDTPSDKTDSSNTSTYSYREVTWATMFDHLVEGRRRGEDEVDKYSITYTGEAFPLAIVLKDRSGRSKLHHPGPPCPSNDITTEQHDLLHHPPYMLPEDVAFLEAKKAFETPEKETMDALIRIFLSRVLPLYPIVNRQEFLQQYSAQRVPWILIHALCFVASTFCPIHILHRARFESRRQARWSFYSKAKALFDTGYEDNKIVMLQVSILMSFWGGGPNNYWNFYSWISTGVTIAETLGCHRSMAGTNIKPQDKSLLKRLWWILVIRDTHCAALVGRPFRINLDHCDVDHLTQEDFQHDDPGTDADANADIMSSYVHASGIYQIAISKLSLILRRIIMTRFYTSDNPLSLSSIQDMLSEWRAELPHQLEWTDTSSCSNMFSSCLFILYHHHIILADLSCPLEQPNPSSGGFPELGQCSDAISHSAAQKIAAMACTVVTKSDVLIMPHELFHGIFLAAMVFYTRTKHPQPIIAQLGHAGLTNCQMALHESRDCWDPSPWILHLLDNLGPAPADAAQGGSNEDFMINGIQASLDFTGLGDGGFSPGSYDIWQNHPVLCNLFEAPADAPIIPGMSERACAAPWF